ncbi:MAG: TetR/AcrR family transcriptional regulator [Sphingobium sp.]|nr:TetR/AcrR family transcriptional regulator [Sphingobium sp.]
MPDQERSRYRPSLKRDSTRVQNSSKIEDAAWKVFSTIGLDAAAVRDIVEESGISAGTFYNYYGTKEAVFNVLVTRLIARFRQEGRVARAGASDVETMLERGYGAFISLVLSIDGAPRFFEVNQHHIRSRLYGADEIRGTLADLTEEFGRLAILDGMHETERRLFISILFSSGVEGMFAAFKDGTASALPISTALARLLARGVAGSGAPTYAARRADCQDREQ